LRLGVVGGTFDPVHVGHVAMAEAAIRCAGLDRVLLVPAALPPHRRPAAASSEDRLEMCRLATAGVAGIEVLDLELRRGGASYTVDTLEELARANPGAELHLVLGWDAARELRSWHRPEEVLRLARLVVVSRPGLPDPQEADLRAAGIDPARVLLCPERTPDVKATEIRRRLAAGEDAAALLHPAVAEYVRRRGLYSRRPGDNRSVD
jgi:nicotinate-nucleotide adenylyltransferase